MENNEGMHTLFPYAILKKLQKYTKNI